MNLKYWISNRFANKITYIDYGNKMMNKRSQTEDLYRS